MTAWNKGLTKETDARVAKYTKSAAEAKRGKKLKHLASFQFKKGKSAWNAGIKHTKEQIKKMNLNGLKIGHGLFKGLNRKANYPNQHYWVRMHKGKAVKCSIPGCERRNRVEWANISQEYRWDLDDWISLCKMHHVHYDLGSLNLKGVLHVV